GRGRHSHVSGARGEMGDYAVPRDAGVVDGLWCSFNDCHMIELAQYTADKARLTREEIDRFSADSHKKAAAAQAECRFSKEIVPVSIPQRKGDPIVVSKDEAVRPDTTPEGLAKLPAVTRDKGG